jgi:hypothetical protein
MQTPARGNFGDLAAGSNHFLAFKAKLDVFSSIYVGYWIDSEAKPGGEGQLMPDLTRRQKKWW